MDAFPGKRSPRRFVLSGAVLPTYGYYVYKRFTIADARRWLLAGPFESAVGYEETAAVLSNLTGVQVEKKRQRVVMDPRDEALIFRITGPNGSWRPDRGEKGRLGADYVRQHRQLGLLVRKL